ncbi:MAG: alpha/beta fold hydrolase, partial [Panacagrimonas sp.]
MAHSVVNGARLAWQQLGQGPDLVLLHGLAASRAFWFPLAIRLAPHFRVTLFDLRGHGYSERTASGYSSAAMGHDLIGLLDALDIDKASIAGHSYGGGAALEAAISAPARFRHLALLDVRVQALQPQMRLEDMLPLSGFEQGVLDRGGGYAFLAGETQIGFRFLEEAARQRVMGLE